jgi:hypothetical protein
MLMMNELTGFDFDASRLGLTSTTAGTPSSSVGFNGTFFDRSIQIPNNSIVWRVGAHCTAATTITFKIGERTGAGNYTINVSEAFSHGGTGMEYFDLTTPYRVPSTGTHYPGYFLNASSAFIASVLRAFKTGNLTGVQTGFTESSNPLLQASFQY